MMFNLEKMFLTIKLRLILEHKHFIKNMGTFYKNNETILFKN